MRNYSMAKLKLQQEIGGKKMELKKQTIRLSDAYNRIGLGSRASRVADCGTFLEFHVTEDRSRLVRANFCRDRLCPYCQDRRSMKIFWQVSEVMKELERQKLRFVFLTLTVRNCGGSELAGIIDILLDGFRKLSHKNKMWKRSVLGCIRTLEVTRNPVDCSWHPHLHLILAVPQSYFDRNSKYWISTNQWVKSWRACCALDYDPVCFVEAIKAGDDFQRRRMALEIGGGVGKNERRTSLAALDRVLADQQLGGEYREAVARTGRYICKSSSDFLGAQPVVDGNGQLLNPHLVLPDSIVDDNVRTLLEGLSGRRLISWTGAFRDARQKLKMDDAEDGDLVHVKGELQSELEYIIVRYQWRAGVYVEVSETFLPKL